MTFIKVLALIGVLLVGIPSLWCICYVLWEFAKCVRKMTWDELMGIMFQIGFIILVTAAAGWIVLASHEEPITADHSTDTDEQISTPGGKLQPIGVTANEALHMEGRGLQEQGAESSGD